MTKKTIHEGKRFRVNYEYESAPGIVFPEPTRTKQSFKDECDINNVLKKYQKTGTLPDMIKREPRYGDFSSAVDFQEALNIVITAEEQFMALTAKQRDRFNNDPARFLEFATNENNIDEMVTLGLAKKPAPEPSSSVSQPPSLASSSSGAGQAPKKPDA